MAKEITTGGKMKALITALGIVLTACSVSAKEYHVSVTGLDVNLGTRSNPFKTISAAAEVAQPGDVITVHEGTYRERINPPRGGTYDDKRIVYQAAKGEKVFIKGSEIVTGWRKLANDTWEVTIPNCFFGNFNPYSNLIHGDWFRDQGREHHTGAVYLNGHWLVEAKSLDDVLTPLGSAAENYSCNVSDGLWFAEVDSENTVLRAQFKGVDPNENGIEINARQTVFYPAEPGRNYITVRGFTMQHAATPWAPPTAEQIGLIGTHWSKGWIIEDNVISHSVCSGITLGKHGDEFDNTSANSAEGYVKTIERAHAFDIPWTKGNIGHHIVRNNTISHCEQTGICGSLGCSFSTVTDNAIHDIHDRQLFSGAEMAGIKFHGAIDTKINRNHIYRTTRGLWLDWMSQGTRVSQNLFHDNGPREDLFVEVNHGPYVVENNIFLSAISMMDNSQGGAFLHNLFGGTISCRPQSRVTPYHKAHSTEIAGMETTRCGDNRFFNNIFMEDVLGVYEDKLPIYQSGNVLAEEGISFDAEKVSISLSPVVAKALAGQDCKIVTSKMLGRAKFSDLPYVDVDGKPIRIDTDYFRKKRNLKNPVPGPFAGLEDLAQSIKLK